MAVFSGADLLLPKEDLVQKWAVVACDQYTSQPEYWENVEKYVGEAPSTLRTILPEARLQEDNGEQISRIHQTMEQYLKQDLWRKYPDSFVYVERTLHDGSVRRGVVGSIDLEQYDYSDKSTAQIRATEKTVVERIPARKAIRQGAALDMSHIILLADDVEDLILGHLTAKKKHLTPVYDLDLMAEGGHISGWLVEKEQAKDLREKINLYEQKMAGRGGSKASMAYAVGDGNHSLAAAKACYQKLRESKTAEELETNPLRYALVELENIHHKEQEFEPIHRIVKISDPVRFLDKLQEDCCAQEGYPVKWYMDERSGCVYLDPKLGKSAVSILQAFLDQNLENVAQQLDYIHGEHVVQELAQKEGRLGLALPPISKGDFFESLIVDGVLPRKTFSIGQAQEKRFYLETRSLTGK